MNKRFEAGYGARSHAKPTADAVQEQAAPAEENKLPRQLDPFQSISLTKTQSMSGGTVNCPAALLGAFRHGNNPPVLPGEEKQL